MGAAGMRDLCRIIEALLFVADGPLSAEQIQEAVSEASTEEITASLEELEALYGDGNRGIALFRVGNGFQILTRPEMSGWVERLLAGRRRQRLSRAALEVLAIVAYRQPITRGEIETVRGVDCGATLHTLLERKLVTIKGRARAVGHPLLYATTPLFLEHFGLSAIEELPKLEEFAALADREEARAELERAGLLPVPGESQTEDGGIGPLEESDSASVSELAEDELAEDEPAEGEPAESLAQEQAVLESTEETVSTLSCGDSVDSNEGGIETSILPPA